MGQYNPTIVKELRPVIRRLRKEGWTIVPTGKGHTRVLTPDGKTATILASSTRNRQAADHALRDLRKAGADV